VIGFIGKKKETIIVQFDDKPGQSVSVKKADVIELFRKTKFASLVLKHKIFTLDYSSAFEVEITILTIRSISSGGKGQRFESSQARHSKRLSSM
jgi:hypothetical protein